MKKTFVIAVVILCGAVVAVAGPKSKKAPTEQIASMDWLAGDWVGEIWGGHFHAYYCTPEGGRVMSYNYLEKSGKKTYFEFEVFEPEGDKVMFRPFPGGKKATPLTLTSCDPQKRKVVFENPEKDFPTKMVYHRVEDDRLVITLSDPHHESDKVEKFDLKRK